jgi:hypothetical protein
MLQHKAPHANWEPDEKHNSSGLWACMLHASACLGC